VINNEMPMFINFMNTITEYYGKPKLSGPIIEIYFKGLIDYSFDQVQGATSKHMTDPSSGQFLPKIADIKKHIDGGAITHDEVLSAARLKSTPLGILCRIQIGSYDLEHQTDMFYLKQRAQECIDKMEGWKSRSITGNYTDHEVLTMLNNHVNPENPFHIGLQPPNMSEENKMRCKAIYIAEIRDRPNEEVLMLTKEEQNTVTPEGLAVLARLMDED